MHRQAHARLLHKHPAHARMKTRTPPAPVVVDPGGPDKVHDDRPNDWDTVTGARPRTLQRAMLRDGAERRSQVGVALQLARARRAPVSAQHRACRHAARTLQRLRVLVPLVPALA